MYKAKVKATAKVNLYWFVLGLTLLERITKFYKKCMQGNKVTIFHTLHGRLGELGGINATYLVPEMAKTLS